MSPIEKRKGDINRPGNNTSPYQRTQRRVRNLSEEVEYSYSNHTRSYNNGSFETTKTTTDSEGSQDESSWTKENCNLAPKPYIPYKPECYNSTPNHKFRDGISEDRKDARSYGIYLFFVMFGVVLLFGVARIKNSVGETPSKNCSYHDLQEHFSKEKETIWRHLSIGLENILNHKVDKPGVYLFIHKNKEYLRDFVKKVAEKSSSCFESTMTPVELTEDEFSNTDDYGHIIESFKKNIKRSHVILIANLNEIPAEAAVALHTICDTYSPISKDVIIFLTLVPSPFDGNPTFIARETLTTLWGSKLTQNQLDALITRVTDAVIQLQG